MSDDEQTKIVELRQQLKEIVDANTALVEEMRRSGIVLNLDSMFPQRLEHLIEYLFLDLEEERLHFELAWQSKLHEGLKNTKREANKARLLAGGHQPKGKGVILP